MAKKSAPQAAVNVDEPWRAQDDAHTLHRAGEIMSDSKRAKAAMAHAATMAQHVKRIAQSSKPVSVKSPPSLGFAKGRK